MREDIAQHECSNEDCQALFREVNAKDKPLSFEHWEHMYQNFHRLFQNTKQTGITKSQINYEELKK